MKKRSFSIENIKRKLTELSVEYKEPLPISRGICLLFAPFRHQQDQGEERGAGGMEPRVKKEKLEPQQEEKKENQEEEYDDDDEIPFTFEEDEALVMGMIQGVNRIIGKTATECLQRYRTIFSELLEEPWTVEQEEILFECIQKAADSSRQGNEGHLPPFDLEHCPKQWFENQYRKKGPLSYALPNRNPELCWRRYCFIKEKCTEILQTKKIASKAKEKEKEEEEQEDEDEDEEEKEENYSGPIRIKKEK